MLRFKLLASTIPLVLAAIFARSEGKPPQQPCIASGESTVQIAAAPWQAQSYVSFTDDAARATVRVQIVDAAELADFAVVDDVDSAEPGACNGIGTTRFIAISTTPSATEPMIYLSGEAGADYRIFVKSRRFTSRDAAALIVGARGDRSRMAQATL